jgi:glutathione S-transferase
MIDFKKELLKYKPARTVDDLQDGISTGEITDINEILQYLAAQLFEPGTEKREPKKPR